MSNQPRDVRPVAAELYFLPITTRVPLKFGPEVTTEVTCARVKLTVEGAAGRRAEGWGETPLSVQWVWPSDLSYEARLDVLRVFCRELVELWGGGSLETPGHSMEVGRFVLEQALPDLYYRFNFGRDDRETMPWLAALACNSAFDLALHDAYGVFHAVPTYATYNARYMNADLSAYLTPAAGTGVSFAGKYPADFLVHPRPDRLVAWHLVGGLDPLEPGDLTGREPSDGEPVTLRDWVKRDGLTCLKVKLRGNDPHWDHTRLVAVGRIAVEEGVHWLTADFNCTVDDPAYVTAILDRLLVEHPRLYGMILYVEQPFPYDLHAHRTDVRTVSARKPLFMDESAHDWQVVRLGRSLGWTGVALKTCKTQTGALLSLCWAKAHGMTLMVQDLTNPMLAQVPHVLLAAHAGTIMGVESNGMQFYPEASRPEAEVHPGLYRRRGGELDLSTVNGPGFGYRLAEIVRDLPPPAAAREASTGSPRPQRPAADRTTSIESVTPTMSDNQVIWLTLCFHAASASSPGQPFEISEVSPEVARALRITDLEARSRISLLVAELGRFPDGSQFFRRIGDAVVPLPEFSKVPPDTHGRLDAYPFEL